MNWQPIETYDALKDKPKRAVFYFRAEGKFGKAGYLGATVQLTRTYGNRTCTLWYPLPDTDELDKASR